MIQILFQLLGAYFVGIFCAIAVEAPKREMLRCATISTFGWALYLFCRHDLHFTTTMSTYVASVGIASLAHWFARIYHEPVTIFFIPGFFTLVPGGGMYRTALYIIQAQYGKGVRELAVTLMTALAIALAVFTVDTMVQVIYKQKLPKFVRRNRRLFR